MGLAEKKVIKNLEDNVIPGMVSRLKDVIGVEITIECNWESFETKAQLLEVEHQALGRIAEGLEKIAKDDLGKEALAESLTKIVLNNITDSLAKKIQLVDGVLSVDANWINLSSGLFIPEEYVKAIESVL